MPPVDSIRLVITSIRAIFAGGAAVSGENVVLAEQTEDGLRIR
jgi:hypothetical protein